ncbi:hypothetical protein ACQJBY_014153 [Aegilops geniculata]
MADKNPPPLVQKQRGPIPPKNPGRRQPPGGARAAAPPGKGRVVDKHTCNLGEDQFVSAPMEDTLCGRPIGAAEKMHSTPRPAKRRAAQDCMGIGLRACKKKTWDEALKTHSK